MKLNKKRKGVSGIVIAIIAIISVLAIFLIPSYNGLVKQKEQLDESYAQVQNVVQRRADLIPNLVNTVKGYSKHEKDTLTEVTQARAGIQNAKGPKELADANEQMSQAIRNINVVAESYPELKADKQFIQLMDELAGTENRISVERKNYNNEVKDYNTKVKSFPTSIFASMMGFEKAEYFEADASAQNAPKVNFGS